MESLRSTTRLTPTLSPTNRWRTASRTRSASSRQCVVLRGHERRRGALSRLGRIALFDDALIVNELLAWVDGASLCGLCVASGALRCYASLEDLWKGIYLRRCARSGAPLRYAMGSWKCTTLGRARRAVSRRVFSDAAGVPVVIEGGCAADAAKPSGTGASSSGAGDRLPRRRYEFALREFLSYAADNGDDQPLYLFDKRFGEAAPELLDAYAPAPYLDDDLFGLLDDEAAKQPDWRWIIVGGERSGARGTRTRTARRRGTRRSGAGAGSSSRPDDAAGVRPSAAASTSSRP
ncbi:hypothetical protein JL720_15907 [Aureococcus anophagefferens]|nr:hypothetical protein JL720_15907 [Aureococcus anophagefferens]